MFGHNYNWFPSIFSFISFYTTNSNTHSQSWLCPHLQNVNSELGGNCFFVSEAPTFGMTFIYPQFATLREFSDLISIATEFSCGAQFYASHIKAAIGENKAENDRW